MEEVYKQPLNNEISTLYTPETAYCVLKNGTREEIFKMLQHQIDSYYVNEKCDTMLHAILRNDKLIEKDVTEILMIFLTQRVCPNITNNNEETVLHLAVERRMKSTVDCLIKFKANVNIVNKRGDSIAHFFVEDEYKKYRSSINYPIMNTVENRDAMENSSVAFLQFLIAQGVNFHCKNKEGRSASHLAIVYYLPHILPTLLEHIDDIMDTDTNNKTLLELLLEESISISRSHLPDKNQYSGYKSRCSATIFRILLKKVISVDNRASVLNVAKEKRNISIMQALTKYYLNNREDKNYANNLEAKELHMIKFLKDSKVDFNFRLENGQNLLHWLAEEKNDGSTNSQFCSEMCDFLVFCGYEVNAIDNEGKSALQLAVGHTNVPMVRKLIELGADLNCRNKDMKTPLHEAVMMNQSEEIVKLLLNSGADVNVEDSKGSRPLHFAASNNSLLMSIMLLMNGADVNINGLKPLTWMNKRPRKRRLDERLFSRAEPSLFDVILAKLAETGSFDVDLIDKLLKCKTDLTEDIVQNLKFILPEKNVLPDFHRHWVRLEVIGLPLRRTYKLQLGDIYKTDYRAECLEEMRKLKKTFINDRTSLYDFLRMQVSRRGAYVNNEKLRKLVESRTLFEQFKNYSVTLRASYREAETRKTKLLEPAKARFYELIQNKLTADSIDYIFAYLTNEDLISIIEADVSYNKKSICSYVTDHVFIHNFTDIQKKKSDMFFDALTLKLK